MGCEEIEFLTTFISYGPSRPVSSPTNGIMEAMNSAQRMGDLSPGNTSAHMVLSTTELLEAILLHLDMRSLLTSALRICRKWRDLIHTSPSLQEALFLLPKGNSQRHNATFNPLLVELFPLLFDFPATPTPRPQGHNRFNHEAVESLPIGRRMAAFYRINASWRRMHVRQPLLERMCVWALDKNRGREETMTILRYPEGLRMESLYFLVLKHVWWWDCFVKWGDTQGRELPHHQFVRAHMEEWAEEMMATADVTIGAFADENCIEENSVRNSRKLRGGDGLAETGKYTHFIIFSSSGPSLFLRRTLRVPLTLPA